MKKADNFDASKWLVENKITTQSRLNESTNNNDLKLYYDTLMDVGDEDLAGEYKDIQVKANNFNSISDFIKDDLEILSQDDEDQVNEIKTNFVAAKLRKMSPQEFTDFVTKVGDYDFWSDAPNNIDPFNNVGDRMDVLSTNETEDTNRYFNALIKSNLNEDNDSPIPTDWYDLDWDFSDSYTIDFGDFEVDFDEFKPGIKNGYVVDSNGVKRAIDKSTIKTILQSYRENFS
jgi:hypothetical protein